VSDAVLSRRYARALAEAAAQQGCLARVNGELEALAAGAAQTEEFRLFAGDAARSRTEKRDALQRLGDRLGLGELTCRLLAYLTEKRRLLLLAQVASALSKETDERQGVCRAHVTSARPLDPDHRSLIVTQLARITGRQVSLTEDVDESLIAGFQVSLDGRFFDGSLQGQLHSLREAIAHGG
jgi:F-type H+-transporting ATPase subunit delta